MKMSPAGKCLLFGALLCVLLADKIAMESQKGEKHAHPEVVTKYGRIRGMRTSVKGSHKSVNVFLNVPFAKAPIGPLRFSPPQPVKPWRHVRDATSYPAMCLQDLKWMDITKKMLNAKYPNLTVSEDCLYLNVYSPNTNSKLPVMVWIHGEGFITGGASVYDGSAFSAYENVVIVTVQYRLGVFGFMSTGSKAARGNWGLLDQVAALRWVQENIKDFGGDPNSVTIFGESAGGASVAAQILSPLSKGLFHKAISESGTALVPGFVVDKKTIRGYWVKVAQLSSCPENEDELIHCLRNKPEELLRKVNDKLIEELVYFPPVVDGVFFPKTPEELLAAKTFSVVPYMQGFNNNEFGFYLPMVFNEPGLTKPMDRKQIAAAFQQLVRKWNLKLSEDQQKKALKKYLRDTNNKTKLQYDFQELLGDLIFGVQALRTANSHRASGAPVYLYEFQHRPSAYKNTKPSYVKADHFDEVGFVFGGPFLKGDANYLAEATKEEKQFSRKIMKYWGSFARTGDPNGGGLTRWPRYDQNGWYLKLNLNQSVGKHLKEDKHKFWGMLLRDQWKELK